MILRATWDYIERLDEFLAWTQAGAESAQRAGRGGVEHRQALPGRSGRRRRADRAEPVLRAGRAGAPACAARWWSNRQSVRDPLAHNGSPIRRRRAHHARAAGGRAHRAGAAVRRARRRRRDGAGVPRRPAVARVHQGADPAAAGKQARRSTSRAPTPRSRCRRPSRTSSCGTSAMPRWPPRPTTWASTPAELLYARVDVIGGPRRSAAAGAGAGGAVAGLAPARRDHPDAAAARVRARRRVSPGPARARSVLASTPIARRWRPCTRPRPRRARRPAPRARR